MRALFGRDRDLTWVLAVAILSLGASILIGRHHGQVVDFVAGFFLGVALALSVCYLVLAAWRGGSGLTGGRVSAASSTGRRTAGR